MTTPSVALASLDSALPARIAALELNARAALGLTEQLRNLLPEPERAHLVSASLRDDTLSLSMDSAAWCPRVRFRAEDLRAALKAAGGPDFVKLKVRVGRKGP
jgi:hypothetical protein